MWVAVSLFFSLVLLHGPRGQFSSRQRKEEEKYDWYTEHCTGWSVRACLGPCWNKAPVSDVTKRQAEERLTVTTLPGRGGQHQNSSLVILLCVQQRCRSKRSQPPPHWSKRRGCCPWMHQRRRPASKRAWGTKCRQPPPAAQHQALGQSPKQVQVETGILWMIWLAISDNWQSFFVSYCSWPYISMS